MMVKRTINIEIDGEKDAVDACASLILAGVVGDVKWKIEQRMDFLDSDGLVIPPAEIVAALKADRAAADRGRGIGR